MWKLVLIIQNYLAGSYRRNLRFITASSTMSGIPNIQGCSTQRTTSTARPDPVNPKSHPLKPSVKNAYLSSI